MWTSHFTPAPQTLSLPPSISLVGLSLSRSCPPRARSRRRPPAPQRRPQAAPCPPELHADDAPHSPAPGRRRMTPTRRPLLPAQQGHDAPQFADAPHAAAPGRPSSPPTRRPPAPGRRTRGTQQGNTRGKAPKSFRGQAWSPPLHCHHSSEEQLDRVNHSS
ncbi:hypothetical protein PVAP13_9NG220846 [Panicum virgatum]|uniref:Uncharacterized protein n=1 Tax=Panicum virgatum TaxID=38727 RepID=A0A8T0MNA9_PANVG|nr:hypothetical protein PVAP13_9NG220846 [Panicum virgatum]